MKKILSILVLLLIIPLHAQKELQKADELYEGYEYIKARDIYLKLYKRGLRSVELYKRLGDSYFKTAEYEEAVKWYRRLFKEGFNLEPEYYFRYGQSLKATGNIEEGDKFIKQYYELINDNIRLKQLQKKANILYDKDIQLEYSTYNVDTLEKINTKLSEYSPVVFQKRLYFTSNGHKPKGYKKYLWNGLPFTDLYYSRIKGPDKVTFPRPLRGEINSNYFEASCTFTEDGKTMYYSRTDYFQDKLNVDENMVNKLKIFRAEYINGEWRTIEKLPFCSDNFTYSHPALSPDGKRLYFASNMPGTYGESDLWYVEIYEDNSYSYPQNLGPKINTSERESFPFISKDNKLYFASDGQIGYGGLDIFVTEIREDGSFGDVLNLGPPINRNTDDFSFYIDPENNYGYFASNRPGGKGMDDIYVFQKTDYLVKGSEKEKIARRQDTIKVGIPKKKFLKHGEDLGKLIKLNPIYFEYKSAEITVRAAVELEKVIAVLKRYPHLKLHIVAHTDCIGSDAYNMNLSMERAKSTYKYIVEEGGIDPSRITYEGRGEREPVERCKVCETCPDVIRSKNRRSEFIIIDEQNGETAPANPENNTPAPSGGQ